MTLLEQVQAYFQSSLNTHDGDYESAYNDLYERYMYDDFDDITYSGDDIAAARAFCSNPSQDI